MIESENELRAFLSRTSLARRQIAVLVVPETQETVFAIEPGSKALEDWSTLRSVVDQTGRWPVLTLLHSNASDRWEEQVRRADLFSRFYFKQERRDTRKGDGPDAILEAAEGLDVAAHFAGFGEDDTVSVDDYFKIELERTQAQFGRAPRIGNPLTFMSDNRLFSVEDVERWIFEWEIANCPDALRLPEHGLVHISWFEPINEPRALLLMPSARGWEVPAYINWFASYLCHSQFVVALLKEWHLQYGAELVAHFGTMLQLRAARRPETAREAFHLAWQQHMISPCTTILPGVSLRDHARALMHTNEWFLHERP